MTKKRESSHKLLHVFSIYRSAIFLKGQVDFINKNGFKITVFTSGSTGVYEMLSQKVVTAKEVHITRRISPWEDIVTILKLCKEFKNINPEIVHGHTPKGGLLSMIAAFIMRVPVRIYHLRGLPYESAVGIKKKILMATEWVSCFCSHQVIAVSPSLMNRVINDNIVPINKIKVLAGGSGNGVNSETYFNPMLIDKDVVKNLRLKYHLNSNDYVIGFIGRLHRDKGVFELLKAWTQIKATCSNAKLVIMGEIEQSKMGTVDTNAMISDELHEQMRSDNFIIWIDEKIHNMREFYALMNLLVLPTYREGLPNVLLEAAAMQLPVVATNVTGCVDVVIDGETGSLIPVKSIESLVQKVIYYIQNPNIGVLHGKQAREHIFNNFRPELIWSELLETYQQLLTKNKKNV